MTSIYRAVKRNMKRRGPRTLDRNWNFLIWCVAKSKTFSFESTYTRMQMKGMVPESKRIREAYLNGKSSN